MPLRAAYRPLRPDLDDFLFAEIGAEEHGVSLSTLSALTRLGLDPWEEAGRLSRLSKREAVEQLARLIGELPDIQRSFPNAREIAAGLIDRLPRHQGEASPPPSQIQSRFVRRRPSSLNESELLMCWLIAAAAFLAGIILYGGFTFGDGL